MQFVLDAIVPEILDAAEAFTRDAARVVGTDAAFADLPGTHLEMKGELFVDGIGCASWRRRPSKGAGQPAEVETHGAPGAGRRNAVAIAWT
jgi:hypothetical protein